MFKIVPKRQGFGVTEGASSKKLATVNGGELSVDLDDQDGTRLIFRLP